MSDTTGYYYDHQLKTYMLQFMAIFSDLYVAVGHRSDTSSNLAEVPIHYGHPDRVVAAILAQNTHNTPIRMPTMSAFMRTFQIDSARMAGVGVEQRTTYVPVGGLVPDDIRTVNQRKPIPYVIDVDLSIHTSNDDQHFQILEQVLPLFEPTLVIQTSDSPLDRTRLVSIDLKSIQLDSNFPIGTDRRIVQSTLTFSMQAWLSMPAVVKNNAIKRIRARIGAVDGDLSNALDVISDLDAQGIEYKTIAEAPTGI